MTRRALTVIFLSLAIASCDNAEQTSSHYAAEPAAAPMAVDGMVAGVSESSGGLQKLEGGESYTYDHNLTISMASGFVKARFERARDYCQNDPALKCKVTSASFRLLGEPDAPLPVANLSVALPHDSVAQFESSLVAALQDEDKGDIIIKSRQTSAQNVTNQVRDIAARLSQLTNYRDRMIELSKRKNATTEDLIKVEAEISRTQSEIEQIEGQRRDLAERIAKENLSISFEAQSTASDALQPVREVWQSSLRTMADSAAGALAFIVGSIPWIPVLLIVYFLGRFLWRRARKSAS